MKEITAPMQKDKLEFIKNPVVAEFLGLAPNSDFSESRLEGSIITHLQKFIMEMGKGNEKVREDGIPGITNYIFSETAARGLYRRWADLDRKSTRLNSSHT